MQKESKTIQRKELTEYETVITEKIKSRIEFLDFIKKGIQFYGYEKYKLEISGLKLDKNLDTEPSLRIPYNLSSSDKESEKINLVISTCLSNYKFRKLSIDDVTSHAFRGNVTDLRVVIINLLHKYIAINPTRIASILKRSRQVVHTSFLILENAKKDDSNGALITMYNKMDYQVGLLIDGLIPIVNHNENTKNIIKLETKRDVILAKIFKRVNNLVLSEYKISKFYNNGKQSLVDINTKICISLLRENMSITCVELTSFYGLKKNSVQAIVTNHCRALKNDYSYARKYIAINKAINNDKIFNNLKQQAITK